MRWHSKGCRGRHPIAPPFLQITKLDNRTNMRTFCPHMTAKITDYEGTFWRDGLLCHTPEKIAAIKTGGRITESARWDCARPDQRAIMRPDLNPNKRWYEQQAWRQ